MANFDDKPSIQYEADDSTIGVGEVTEVYNDTGHKQEMERQFSLLSVCSIGISTGNVWAALGGSIVCHSHVSPGSVQGSKVSDLNPGHSALQRRPARRHLRVHRGVGVLLDDRRLHR